MLRPVGVEHDDAEVLRRALGQLYHAVEHGGGGSAEAGEHPDGNHDDENTPFGAQYVSFDGEHNGDVPVGMREQALNMTLITNKKKCLFKTFITRVHSVNSCARLRICLYNGESLDGTKPQFQVKHHHNYSNLIRFQTLK